jgi:hypothetical protein
MRTIGFRTHVLLALGAAGGILLALGLPWYAPSPGNPGGPTDVGHLDGHMERTFATVGRALANADGTTGWHALGSAAAALAGLAGLAALLTALSLAPATPRIARDVARLAALGAVGIIAWRLIDPPGASGASELRHGALLAGVCGLMLLSGTFSVAAAPSRRRSAPPARYQPPPPPPSYDTAGSAPPPGA